MNKGERRFKTDEIISYKERVRTYMLQDKMTEEQKKAWNRKPYSYGGTK